MKAVILAAGKGTRMGELTREIPKPMIPVAGRPVVEHIMRGLMRAGVREFVLVTRYLSEKIEEYFGDGERIGASVRYVLQADRYGTGAALSMARDLTGNEPLLMTFGDIITSWRNYAGLLEVFTQSACHAAITLNWVQDPTTGAAVYLDERECVSRIVEKPPRGQSASQWNSSGIFAFQPVIYEYLERLEPSGRGEYELPDAMNAMAADGLCVRPYYLTGAWRDVGRAEDIPAAEELVRQEESDASAGG